MASALNDTFPFFTAIALPLLLLVHPAASFFFVSRGHLPTSRLLYSTRTSLATSSISLILTVTIVE